MSTPTPRWLVTVEHNYLPPFIVTGPSDQAAEQVAARLRKHIHGDFEVVFPVNPNTLELSGAGHIERPNRTRLGKITVKHFGYAQAAA